MEKTSTDKLNCLKYSSIVLDEIPNALRQTFKAMWNSKIAVLPGNKPWDDSITVRTFLLKSEGGKTDIPTNKSIDEWDCTALLKATIFAQTFAVSGVKGPKKTLAEVYLKGRKPKPNPFHRTVISPTGNHDETMTLAIDQLRLLRNFICHSARASISKADYERYVLLIKDAFKALNVPTDSVDVIDCLSESDFPTAKVNELNERITNELLEINQFLHESNHFLQENNHFLQEEVLNKISDLSEELKKLKKELQQPTKVLERLAKCEFKSNIERLNESFHSNTRKWLFKELDCWFQNKDSQVMVLTAGPGIGKSVFAAKVCKMYEEKEQLAACHFCKFNHSDYSNPHKMMQSLASHMCENVPGFREKLTEQLQRAHSKESITDAFRVLLNDPLNSLPGEKPLLLVIDGLDESEKGGKSELLDLIAKEFPLLPKWLKIFITSRPELPVRNKLHLFNPIEISPNDEDNEADLRYYFQTCLTCHNQMDDSKLDQLVKKCKGSFLYAYHCQLELRRLPVNTDVVAFAPKGISSVYEDYFTRLEKELKELSPNIQFDRILEALVAMEGPLPLSFISDILELPGDNRSMRKVLQNVNESLSALLLVYDDCLTVFHKSVVDWITCQGYEQHSFSIQEEECISGNKYLWRACRKWLVGSKQKEFNIYHYASKHGPRHLRKITMQPPPEKWLKDRETLMDDEETESMVKGLVTVLSQNSEPFGWGWVIAKDNEDVFLLTTSTVLLCLKNSLPNDSCKENVVVLHFVAKKFTLCCTTGREDDFAVISSDDKSVFNYAVLKLKLSRENNLQFSFTSNCVTKQSPSPGDKLTCIVSSHYNKFFKANVSVLQKPKDLLRWLKEGIENYPLVWCQPEMNWDITEDLYDILIPIIGLDSTSDGTFILRGNSSKSMQVVGMVNRSAKVRVDGRQVDFAVHIEKIIENINKKQPNLARKLFSSYF